MSSTNVPLQPIRKPWYREPWPWLLMAGPAVVVVAGIYTAWLAVASNDGLVTDDYYKKGLAAGETLARSRQAESLGLTVGLRLTRDTLQARLSASQPIDYPDGLRVMLSHPTRAGLDQQIQLKRDGNVFRGEMHLPASGHWLVLVEDDAKTWRLMGSVVLPAAGETVIGGGGAASQLPAR